MSKPSCNRTGYGHIASAHAEAFDQFYREYFNPYLNFHRPCAVPEVTVTAKGKQKRVYRWYATPWEILRQVPGLASFFGCLLITVRNNLSSQLEGVVV